MALTVDDLAHHINTAPPADPSQDRIEMQRAVDTAVQEVTRATGMLGARTVTVTVRAIRGRLLLPYVRLASIGAVTDPGELAVTPTDSDPQAGLVDVGWSSTTSGAWSVVCTGEEWPAALTTAALDWAAHLYDVQRLSTQPVDADEPTPTYSLPNRVEELIRPYRLPGAA